MDKNFEKELGRKLNGRQIEPSANAWERVNLQRGRKSRNHTYIYWIAAAFVLGIGLMLVETGKTEIKTAKEIVQKESATPKATDEKGEIAAKPFPDANQKVTAVQLAKKQKTVASEPVINVQNRKESEISLTMAQMHRKNLEDKVTAEIVLMVESGKTVHEDDVDLLLARARKEIASGNGLSQQTDASALLKASESELDENFRTGIIETLFKQKRIKIALSSH